MNVAVISIALTQQELDKLSAAAKEFCQTDIVAYAKTCLLNMVEQELSLAAMNSEDYMNQEDYECLHPSL